ncbi:SAM-dependent methyltransferase [Putridiphycobacter roseus]|uniref:SAM-dependent methyltransferase n=1 Tax=Putridiphycobacter roseus TaxID=2219161 RepID=A0A2W1NK60_9FLAO|nr:class I SAM-dependent methyltransferase [Putridiphycobacter roseus]PZE16042.1 SAM-dependent methyltransferase [Putridiphycobacter roseus]
MEVEDDYLALNKRVWDNKVAVHLQSDFYDNKNFLKTQTSLNEIELPFLNSIKGKKILHLQCHFGQDSISLAKLGALVTAVDFSPKAIDAAKNLSLKTGVPVQFICSDIYDLPNHLEDEFDLVFSSYGTIGWLPDIKKWAAVVSHFTKPGGKLLLVEFHPFVWMYNDDFSALTYSYFNDETIMEEETGTYANRAADMKATMMTWNHPLSDVFQSLFHNNFKMKEFKEYNYSPYDCFQGTKEIGKGKYIIEKMGRKLPMVYALEMEKLCD